MPPSTNTKEQINKEKTFKSCRNLLVSNTTVYMTKSLPVFIYIIIHTFPRDSDPKIPDRILLTRRTIPSADYSNPSTKFSCWLILLFKFLYDINTEYKKQESFIVYTNNSTVLFFYNLHMESMQSSADRHAHSREIVRTSINEYET